MALETVADGPVVPESALTGFAVPSRFNAPPGWPEPQPGWVPPRDWRPDPSWPPAPPGWQWWIPDDGPATDAAALRAEGPGGVHDAPPISEYADAGGGPSPTTSPSPQAGDWTPSGDPRDAVALHYRPPAYASDLAWVIAGVKRAGWVTVAGLSTWGPGLLIPYLLLPVVAIAGIAGFFTAGVLGAMIGAGLGLAICVLLMATGFLFLPVALALAGVYRIGVSLVFFVGDVAGVALLLAAMVWLEPTLARIGGARAPSAREREKLDPILERVVRRAGLQVRPRIMINDRADVNASMGARILTLNAGLGLHREAPEGVPDQQLEAVLAHEIGHWVNADSMALHVNYVLLLPLRACVAAANSLARLRYGGLLSAIFLFGPRVWFRFLVGPLTRRQAHVAEYGADRFAASLGYQADLCAMLDSSPKYAFAAQTWDDFIASTHPPVELRIDQLRALPQPRDAREVGNGD